MKIHVLNGDGLAHDFNLDGEIIVCRECLIEGETIANSLDDFWKIRAKFIEKTYKDKNYFEKTVAELEKLKQVSAKDEVNLWFGNDLFCQVNLWFCLNLLEKTGAEIYRVFSDSNNWNCTFDNLEHCFTNRIKLSGKDVQLGSKLWRAYQISDYKQLTLLGKVETRAFLHLDEVCQADIEKKSRPQKILSEIDATDFNEIFKQFSQKGAIYGFGDSQVKNIIEKI